MSIKATFIAACFALTAPVGLSAQVWDPDTRLTNEPAPSFTSPNNGQCVAVSGDTVHVVWQDFRDGNNDIYYKRSIDGGETWGVDMGLTTGNPSESITPSVAVSGPRVWVVWCDDRDGNKEIYYKRSNTGGETWGGQQRLTNDGDVSQCPSVAITGDTIHVVWEDSRDGNPEIYYKHSVNGGTNWNTDKRLTNNSSNSLQPSIAVSGLNIHVVWYDNRDDNDEIYYIRSTDGGTNWGSDTRLTTNMEASENPSITVSDSNLHVVWEDCRDGSNPEIYYKRSTNGGTNWGSDTRLTLNDSQQSYPSVAVSSSGVYVVWQDSRQLQTEIYYKRSTDGGTNWGPDMRLTNKSGVTFSYFSSIAVSGTNIHLVWCDNRDGPSSFEIYYKRGREVQPDNLVKNLGESDYTGDDIYNDDGTDQTKEQNVAPGDTAVYHIRIENDGGVMDTVIVTGTGSVDGWTVKYYDALSAGTEITSDVTGSGWSIEDLEPGVYTEIRMEVIPDDNMPGDSTFDNLVTSTSKRDSEKKDVVKVSTTTELEAAYKPDNQIKNSIEVTYSGDDVYNIDGSGQTKSQTVGAGNTAIYHIKVENDGNAADTFVVTGTASSASWDVKYFDALAGGTDITAQVTLPTAGWSTGELAFGNYAEIRVEVTAVSASQGSTFDVFTVSTSKIDDSHKDAVKASTTVGTGAEEEAKPVPLAYSLKVSYLSTGKAVVSYTLPQASNVTLSLYDATGRAVKVLEFGMVDAGSHEVELGDVSLSKGVYFVRLDAGGSALTRKLVLMR